MGFPAQLSAPQKTTLRTSGYWQRTFIAFNPGEIVFQAESDEDITDNPFLAFDWTNTIEGAYTDVWEGMVCYISSPGDDFQKAYKYRGRVRLAPSATEFYIDLNATTLETGDIITVVRDADLMAKVRDDTLVDGSIAWHDLPPMTDGLPSVVVLYDVDNDGTVTFTPAQAGIAVAAGASIDEYEWAISGTGASSISDPAEQNPAIEFEAGYHYLLRLTTTDTLGNSNYILVQVYAVTRAFAAPVILPAAAGNVNQDLDNGYTGSITAYGGVADLPYRTHAVIFCVERFGDNSAAPIVSNVLMHGRLRSESILSEGSAEAGVEQQVTYPIEGITSYMQRLKMPDDIVRHTTDPNEWGEIENPTPYRMAVYALYAYTTLLNLVSFSAGDSLFGAWRVGGEPVAIDGGNALDVLSGLLSRIKAAANYAPDGAIQCEINASYVVDRSGLVTVVDLLPGDTRSIALEIDTSRNVGQVTAFGGTWNSTTNEFDLYTGQSPSIPYSEAPENREANRELLQYDLTIAEAETEIGLRAGNEFAFNNPKWLLRLLLLDSWRWIVATNYQRYTLTYTDAIREIALTTAVKFQCQSVAIAINADGTYDVDAELYQETEFTDAQSIASQLPDNVTAPPVLPVLSNYPAFPSDPLENYPTTSPADDELQPISPYSGWTGYTPFPPDQAAEAANRQGTSRCRSFQVLMRNSGTTNSPFLTVNTAPYQLQISGSGAIGDGTWTHPVNFLTSNGGFVADLFVYGTTSTWSGGTGWQSDNNGGANVMSIAIKYVLSAPSSGFTSINYTYSNNKVGAAVGFFLRLGGSIVYDTGAVAAGIGSGLTFGETGTFPNFDEVVLAIASPDSTGSMVITAAEFEGTGANAFTGAPSTGDSADWFYMYDPNDPESTAELFDVTDGGLIDGNKPGVIPPFSPDHVYTIPFTGTGNAIQAAYALDSYTGVQNQAFTIQACRGN